MCEPHPPQARLPSGTHHVVTLGSGCPSQAGVVLHSLRVTPAPLGAATGNDDDEVNVQLSM